MAPDGQALRHGEAVGFDVTLSTVIAMRRGMLSTEDVERILSLGFKLGLRLEAGGVSFDRMWMSVVERTLHRGGRQRIPIPSPLGQCVFIDDLEFDELRFAVKEVEERASLYRTLSNEKALAASTRLK